MIDVLILPVIVIVLIILFFVESHRELNMIRTTEYIIDSDVPDDMKGKCIVFISDYHEAEDGKHNDKIIDMIKKESPMCVIAGGDMVNSNENPADEHPSIELLNNLAENYKVYYAYGNHEKRLAIDYHEVGAKWNKYLTRLNKDIEILQNKSVKLTDNTYLYGLDIPIEKYGRIRYPKLSVNEINEMVGSKPEGSYTILLGHTPDFYEGYAEWGADLILSGHFHGGIIRVPFIGGLISPRMYMFPKYDYGRYRIDKSTMIVTNGIGQHSIKIRFNNIPEIVIIRFK
ncbi:MAG TPA: hypothetical protein DEO83_07745 [Lachnospiraceae bacterium]|nr:hypothetical protein [Lachnospiraceae bacterium]